MTIEEFRFNVDIKREFEFKENGVTYTLTYDKDEKGNPVIIFGEQYFGTKYRSFGEMMVSAKVGNHFLKEYIKSVKF